MVQELYREVVLAHYQHPSNRRSLPDANASSFSHNPLCGDELSVGARIENGCVADAAFEALGCSIVHASADMMVDLVKGKTLLQASEFMEAFEDMMLAPEPIAPAELGDLRLLQAVRKFPVRIKCALLPWNTLRAALDGYSSPPGGSD